MGRKLVALAALLLCVGPVSATTWDEPWQREVVKKADSFGLFEVVSTDGLKAHLRTLKTLAGQATPSELNLSVDPAMRYTSIFEDERGEFDFRVGQKVYLLPEHGKQGWMVLTPSAGIAPVRDDGRNVAATYRISVHQTLQSIDDYEKVQRCIFQHLHGGNCDESALRVQLDEPLAQPPGSLSENARPEQQALFFRQHVALESAYLLERDVPLATLEPFLRADFFHTQLSAVRALAASHDPQRNARLLAFIKDPTRLPMAQAMAVLMAKEIGDKKLIAELKSWAPKASTAESSLPIAIMDPRVGTAFPSSVRAAIEEL